MATDGEVRAALQWAESMAAEVGEDHRPAAFEQLLRLRLFGSHQTPVTPGQQSSDTSADGLDGAWPEAHEVANGSRKQQTVWATWRLKEEGVPATTEAIRKKIRSELSIAPQNPNNTSKTLGLLTPKYLLREENPDGSGYVYEPSRHALEIFANGR